MGLVHSVLRAAKLSFLRVLRKLFTLHEWPKPAEELVSLALIGLPAPGSLIQDAKDAFADPAKLEELQYYYSELKSNPAWIHFLGRLLAMRDMYRESVLIGERDRFGNDITDKMRASYGTLLQVLAIPAQVAQVRKEATMALGINDSNLT